MRRVMERRRRHEECGAEGCEVVVGTRCEVSARKGRTKSVVGGLRRFDQCMAGIETRLLMLAGLIVVFSFLVNVGLGMRLYEKLKGMEHTTDNV